ncbi:MAG TPA: hypothetical protein PLD79_05625 [Halothiobacillus sp.]|nr:hypothetical protein [Halothiobacillus sp.]
MSHIEQIEMDEHRKQMLGDVRHLVEKYRAIFDWDIPGVNQPEADQLIIQGIHAALDEVGQELTHLKARQVL